MLKHGFVCFSNICFFTEFPYVIPHRLFQVDCEELFIIQCCQVLSIIQILEYHLICNLPPFLLPIGPYCFDRAEGRARTWKEQYGYSFTDEVLSEPLASVPTGPIEHDNSVVILLTCLNYLDQHRLCCFSIGSRSGHPNQLFVFIADAAKHCNT